MNAPLVPFEVIASLGPALGHRRPVRVTQRTGETCWAAALASLFATTLPPLDPTVNFFSENYNIDRARRAGPTETKPPIVDLVTEQGGIVVDWPSYYVPKHVFKQAFKLTLDDVAPPQLRDKLVTAIKAKRVPVLFFNPPRIAPGRGDWRRWKYPALDNPENPDPKRLENANRRLAPVEYSWHAVIIYEVMVSKDGTWVWTVDPDGSQEFLQLENFGEKLDPDATKNPMDRIDWFYFMTSRAIGEPWTGPLW